jgi:hypothetical protein
MSYPPPPPSAAPAPSGKPRLRGRMPLRLALIFGILGIAGLVVGGIIAVNGALKKVDDFSRIDVPSASSGTVNKDTISFGTGGYVAYYEAPDATSDSIPAVPVRITSPSGKQEVLDTPYGGKSGGKDVKSLSYDYNGHKGVALWQFTITEKGDYLVEVAGNQKANGSAKMAFGRSIGKSTAIGGVLVVIGVLLLITAIILLIVGLVKRSRHKKELATAGSYGYPPPPGYGPPAPGYGPPAPGYGPPPGYAPPPQEQGWQQPPPPPPNG